MAFSLKTGREAPVAALESHKPRPVEKQILNAGPSSAYLLDPAILRQIKSIDRHLDLEWRPNGKWWTSYVEYRSKPPAGATPGCWRIVLVGKSGKRKGLRLWPPFAADQRLIGYLRDHWGERLRDPTRYALGQPQFNEELSIQQEKDRRRQAFSKVDSGEIYRSNRAFYNSPKWRGNWQVHSKMPVGPS